MLHIHNMTLTVILLYSVLCYSYCQFKTHVCMQPTLGTFLFTSCN